MKTILQIAEEEGATVNEMSPDGGMNLCFTESTLERFAARIRAEQREKDALICEQRHYTKGDKYFTYPRLAAAIRNSKD